jgi:D-alanine--D-alanine ligase
MATTDMRTTLVVLYGGRSAEHDVSRVTAAHVLRAVDHAAFRVVPVGISRDGEWSIDESLVALLDAGARGLPTELTVGGASTSSSIIATTAAAGPVVVLPLLHGPLGEDGTIQGLLEVLDVPYVGSGVLASAAAMDKGIAKVILAQHGIPQVEWRTYHIDAITPRIIDEAIDFLGLPLFVKPANMGSSIGVSKAKSHEEVRDAVAKAATYDEWIVFEEAAHGREIEVAVLGNLRPEASIAGEIVPSREFYDYEDKYVIDGARLEVPAQLDAKAAEEVRRLAVRAFGALRCEGMARVDFFYEENGRGFLCNEINTIPGFTPISMYPKLWQASGVAYPQLIDKLVNLAIERHSRKRRNTDR